MFVYLRKFWFWILRKISENFANDSLKYLSNLKNYSTKKFYWIISNLSNLNFLYFFPCNKLSIRIWKLHNFFHIIKRFPKILNFTWWCISYFTSFISSSSFSSFAFWLLVCSKFGYSLLNMLHLPFKHFTRFLILQIYLWHMHMLKLFSIYLISQMHFIRFPSVLLLSSHLSPIRVTWYLLVALENNNSKDKAKFWKQL